MTLNLDLANEFAKASLETFDLSGFGVDKKLALKSLAEEILEEYEELNQNKVKQARTKNFNIDGVKPEDYSERMIQLDGDKKIIFGIRHEGARLESPFVHIIPNFDLGLEESKVVYEKYLKDYLSMFGPLSTRLWTNRYHKEEITKSVYMVAHMSDVFAIGKRKDEDLFTLEDIQDDSYHEWYSRLYSEFHQDRPELVDRVSITSKGAMDDSLKEGLLKYGFYNGEKVGLIAAVRSQFLGHEGIYFNEILIDRKFKGKGLAKTLQRKFLCDNAKKNDFVWGTIDHENHPSYRTAASNGRRPIRYETFVKL